MAVYIERVIAVDAFGEGVDLGFQRVAGNEFALRFFAQNEELGDLVVAAACVRIDRQLFQRPFRQGLSIRLHDVARLRECAGRFCRGS